MREARAAFKRFLLDLPSLDPNMRWRCVCVVCVCLHVLGLGFSCSSCDHSTSSARATPSTAACVCPLSFCACENTHTHTHQPEPRKRCLPTRPSTRRSRMTAVFRTSLRMPSERGHSGRRRRRRRNRGLCRTSLRLCCGRCLLMSRRHGRMCVSPFVYTVAFVFLVTLLAVPVPFVRTVPLYPSSLSSMCVSVYSYCVFVSLLVLLRYGSSAFLQTRSNSTFSRRVMRCIVSCF